MDKADNYFFSYSLTVLNIYVIIYTEEVMEVVLNALAFIFVARIDEDLAKSGWYDPEMRWLTAGAMGTAMQGKSKNRFKS